jgi:hypothetical protein
MPLETILIIVSIVSVLLVVILKFVQKCNNYLQEDDPVYQCDVFKKLGCSHIDGVFCDMRTCSILYNFRKTNK